MPMQLNINYLNLFHKSLNDINQKRPESDNKEHPGDGAVGNNEVKPGAGVPDVV